MADYTPVGEQLLEEERPAQRSSKNTWIALVAVGMIAAAALGVAVSARTRSITVASTGAELQASLGNTAAQAGHAEVKAMANFKSQFAGMMLMNQPACRNSHQGYIACLDLVHSAQKLITDLTDPEVSVEQILENIKAEEYDVGSAVAFATMRDDTVEAMAPALAEALESTDNYLTVNGIADLSKCDYVWRGVACLTIVESARTASCDSEEDTRPCAKKVVPIIHILDDLNSEVGADGKVARRRNALQVVGAVAGGIKGAITGGVAGAAAGGAVGSIVPGLGTAAGGIAGGAIGAIGYGTMGAMEGWDKASNLAAPK